MLRKPRQRLWEILDPTRQQYQQGARPWPRERARAGDLGGAAQRFDSADSVAYWLGYYTERLQVALSMADR